MSTAVSRPTGGIVVPTRFQNRAPQGTLGDGISSGFPIIRIRGSKWWLSTGKDEEHRIPVDDLDVVILRAPPFASRAYYKGYKGDRSKGERPLCSSLHGDRPDSDVPEPQSELCGMCPRNQTYTNDRGMKVRDCSNGKRLAVLPWVSWTTELLGKPLLRPCLLRVPGASLQALKVYGEELDRAGVPYYGLLTRISFEEKKEYPQMIFNYNTEIQLDDESAAIIDEMRETADARFITGENAQSMREIDHGEAEKTPPAEVIQKPKPAAVSLAQAVKASKVVEATGETVAVEAEILAPKVTNGKGPQTLAKGKIDDDPSTVNVEVDAGDASDDDLKNEVLKLLGK